jgi:hypothetical protein
MQRLFLVSVLVLGLLVVAGNATPAGEAKAGNAQADFFVAPNGHDGWSGRLAAPNDDKTDGPFTTLARARDAVRAMKRRDGDLKRNVRVLVRGGTYALAEPLTLGPEDSGSEQHSIAYEAYPGEKPVLSGGRAIAGWKRAQGELWTTEIPEAKAGAWRFRQLFIDGRRQTRARAPDTGFFRIVKAAKDARTEFAFRPGDLKNWQNLSEVEAVMFHDWAVSRMPIARVDEAKNTVHFPKPVGYQGLHFTVFCHFDPHQRYYVENARELLDWPGEWYLDRKSGLLTSWPDKRANLERAEVVAPRLERLLVVAGTLDQPVRNVHFRGLTFSHTGWPLPPEGYGGIQAGSYAAERGAWKRLPAAVEFCSAVGCRFEQNRILHVAATALSFETGCRDNAIVGNEIADAGGNGVTLGEPERRPGDQRTVSRNNRIANNHIHDCAIDFHGCVGVWIGHTEKSVVAHNLIHNLPYTGISVGWTWNPNPTPCKENRIESNHIHHVMEAMADGGGIYTLGFQPGTVLRGNLIHDVPRTHGRAYSNGMFIDQGSKGYLFEGNIIYRTPDGAVRFNQCRKDWHTWRENTFVAAFGGADFPAEAAARAGLEPAYRERLLGKR